MKKILFLATVLFSGQILASSPWGLSLSSGLSTDLKRDTAPEKSIDSNFGAGVSYKTKESGSFLAYISYLKNLNNSREGDFGASFFQYSPTAYKINDKFSLSANFRVYAPLNERQRDLQSYQSTLRFAPTLSFKASDKLSLSLSLSLGQNFHEFKQQSSGPYNIRHYFSYGANLSYSINKSWSYSATIKNTTRIRYDGERVEDIFLIDTSINLSFYERFTLSAGYSNQNNFFVAGTSEVDDLLAPETGSIYLNLGASY